MLPALISFSTETGFDCSDYLDGLESVWSALLNVPIEKSLTERCARNAPDTEAHYHPYTSYALNCALAIAETMQFALDGGSDHIEYLQTLAKDSAFLFRSGSENSTMTKLEGASGSHADQLFQDELRRQKEDQLFVSKLPETFDTSVVQLIRDRSRSQSPLLPMLT